MSFQMGRGGEEGQMYHVLNYANDLLPFYMFWVEGTGGYQSFVQFGILEWFLKVDERSGEITTIAHLDYEKRSKFDIVAVRVEESGETIDILVEVDDENDNSPSFADSSVKLEISEFAQLGTSFALPTVTDGDGPKFDVHRFVILQGNVNNVFKRIMV
uniref:CA domain-containing protein n=1 Tax=Caenorhabditis tropicalis TaxID=1561998 RepID=A0A1I7UPC1_9PELO